MQSLIAYAQRIGIKTHGMTQDILTQQVMKMNELILRARARETMRPPPKKKKKVKVEDLDEKREEGSPQLVSLETQIRIMKLIINRQQASNAANKIADYCDQIEVALAQRKTKKHPLSQLRSIVHMFDKWCDIVLPGAKIQKIKDSMAFVIEENQLPDQRDILERLGSQIIGTNKAGTRKGHYRALKMAMYPFLLTKKAKKEGLVMFTNHLILGAMRAILMQPAAQEYFGLNPNSPHKKLGNMTYFIKVKASEEITRGYSLQDLKKSSKKRRFSNVHKSFNSWCNARYSYAQLSIRWSKAPRVQ